MNREEPRRQYYWLVCKDPQTGEPYLIKGGKTEEEARQRGLDFLGNIDFEVRMLPTINISRASAMLRGKRLEDTHSLQKAKKRIGHDRSLARMRRRHGY